MVANNVLAHVPDLGDFVAGFAILLPVQGVLTVEFPHLLRLVQEVQFDTIYHEHFSYLSLLTVQTIVRPEWAARVRCGAFTDPWRLPAAVRLP